MKKLLKTLLLVMLIAVVALSCVSCKNGGDDTSTSVTDEKKSKPSAKEEAEEIVKSFMEALCKMDIEAMAKETTDPERLKEDIGFDDFRGYVMDEIYSGTTPEEAEMMAPLLEPVINTYLEAMFSTMSYEITSSEKEDEGYKITASFTAVDFESAEAELETAMNEDMSALGQEALDELMNDGTITENSTEQEMTEALFKKLAEKLKPIIEKSIKEAPRDTEEYEFVVSKISDKWQIDYDKSEIAELVIGEESENEQ